MVAAGAQLVDHPVVAVRRLRSDQSTSRSIFLMLLVNAFFEMWLFAGGSVFYLVFLVSAVFLLVLVGADILVAVPVGVLGGVALTVAAAVLWLVPGLRPAPAASDLVAAG